MVDPTDAEIEAAIRRELLRPASRTMPVSALAGHLASAVLAAIRGAGYEVAREERGDGARG